MENGVFYIYGRDKTFRPLVIIDAAKLVEFQSKIEGVDLIHFSILILEYLEINMLIPGRIENYILIIDCQNLGVMNTPYALLKSVLSVIQSQYKCKARAIFCLNSPTSMSVIWNTVKLFLDNTTSRKV